MVDSGGDRQSGEGSIYLSVHLGVYNVRDAHIVFLELEAEMYHGDVNMLVGDYLGDRVNQGKVVMEILVYYAHINNSNTIFTPKIGSLCV